jgi:DNA-binding MarR family transcriptional regulator
MGKKSKAKDKDKRKAAAPAPTASHETPAVASVVPAAASHKGDLGRALATRLDSVAIHLTRRLAREDAATGLTPARLSALSALSADGPLTLGALARTERVTAPSMTRLITAMESDGLVERIPSAQDGRKVYVRVTPAGAQVMHTGQERRIKALRNWLGPVGSDDLRRLDDAMVLLESVLRDETS